MFIGMNKSIIQIDLLIDLHHCFDLGPRKLCLIAKCALYKLTMCHQALLIKSHLSVIT